MEKPHIRDVLSVALPLLGLVGISLLSFPSGIKRQVRKEQNNICAKCETKVKKLQIHHIIPQSMGGSDKRSNAVGLCPPDHNEADIEALEKGIFFPNQPK